MHCLNMVLLARHLLISLSAEFSANSHASVAARDYHINDVNILPYVSNIFYIKTYTATLLYTCLPVE